MEAPRVSDDFEWHVAHDVVPETQGIYAGAQWKRSSGNDPSNDNDPESADENEVGPGRLLSIGEPPF